MVQSKVSKSVALELGKGVGLRPLPELAQQPPRIVGSDAQRLRNDDKLRLTAADQRILAELGDFPSKAASRCANLLNDEHCGVHRGAMTINGYKIVFGNDGFGPGEDGNDIRSQLEVVRVVKTIHQITKVWNRPIFEITGFGLSSCGSTWALRVETGYSAWDNILDTAVWDAWFRACGSGLEGHPWPKRLRDEIRHMFYVPSKPALAAGCK
jgi:hypothetical protein